ncbi:hypothetical protein [Streptomyces sp. NPDC005989]|uniref:hypothetical protein n=1 Tax=unclassified Streptomyces TaxID=2593676 RepID=UPI0033CBE0DD
MSEITPNAKGPARIQGAPATIEPTPIPASEVRPEDIGKLAIEYRDGQPVIVVGGGKYVPAGLTAIDAEGKVVAAYTAGSAATTPAPGTSRSLSLTDDVHLDGSVTMVVAYL